MARPSIRRRYAEGFGGAVFLFSADAAKLRRRNAHDGFEHAGTGRFRRAEGRRVGIYQMAINDMDVEESLEIAHEEGQQALDSYWESVEE